MSFTQLWNYLPDGWLPRWQLLIALVSLFNTTQNFVTLKLTRQIYSKASGSVTRLQARTFAVWTLTTAVVRGYAAYNIHNKSIYDMALLTYLIALGHFTSELLIFRTVKLNAVNLNPFIVAITSLIWMVRQYDFYVKA